MVVDTEDRTHRALHSEGAQQTPDGLFYGSEASTLHHLDCSLVAASIAEQDDEQEGDRVGFLPGQPSRPAVSQFSGYVTVNENNGRALFYWFFEAQMSPAQKPLLLWLNGGPGCSSVGYGAASELGPLLVNGNGTGLEFNKFAWNKGHYVPQLAEVVDDHNKNLEANQQINLKGFIVGNAETNDYYDYTGIVEFAWSHSVISDKFYERVKNVCDFRLSPTNNECSHVMNLLFKIYHEIDIYNVYAPRCDTDGSAFSSSFNSSVEKEAKLMIPFSTTTTWRFFSVLPIYSKLVKAGIRIWVYSGDVDGRVPFIGSRYWVEALGLPIKSQWQPWYLLENQVAGRYVEYEGLTMATVRGAGHTVPQDKPAEALVLINSFLSDRQLPTKDI
ncbi:serine carboxypeptidase-like 33 isoform X1 [Panicum miliaceum]|uniref:Serine carboxypeptidase-like 33 isoform X1 n=1 Tax=Panicum miliaceum TaxID=4540 RepID=A0A3L6R291_PANMI|nr:serine carboxypeptidase-like 33 isoform X1 [Panicum miliaceum]